MNEFVRILTFALVGLGPGLANDKELQTSESLTVYATKNETPLDKVNTHTVVITQEEIKKHQWQTVADILHHLPGFSLVRTGGDGGTTTVFTRGASSENLLVLMDGARLNDPSGVGRGYDFAHLTTAAIERIELVLGPQNTLYGTDASSGVINIVSQRGSEETTGQIGFEASDEDTLRTQASLAGASGNLSYSLAGNYYDAKSISARAAVAPLEQEKDGYDNTTLRLGLDYRLQNNDQVSFSLANTDSDGDIDSFDSDDPNYTSSYQQTSMSLSYRRVPEAGNWQWGIYLNGADTKRGNLDLVDPAHPESSGTSRFKGESLGAEFRTQITLNQWSHLLLGLSHEQEEADSTSLSSSMFGAFESADQGETDTSGIYALMHIASETGFDGDLGVRYNDHSVFGVETTYQASGGYLIESAKTRLRGSFATGFKAPSIYQLFSSYGNEALVPETNEALELGVVTRFAEDRGEFGATWFRNDYENLIDFFFDPVTFVSNYRNINKAETEGTEVFAAYRTGKWSLRISYADLDADNTSTPDLPIPLIRRFDNKAGIQLQTTPTENLGLFCDVLFYGESLDTDFASWPASNVVLEKYNLINLGLRYSLRGKLVLNLRGENLADESYVQVLGYNTIGRRIFAGAAYKF